MSKKTQVLLVVASFLFFWIIINLAIGTNEAPTSLKELTLIHNTRGVRASRIVNWDQLQM